MNVMRLHQNFKLRILLHQSLGTLQKNINLQP